jgi:hypothetical protein
MGGFVTAPYRPGDLVAAIGLEDDGKVMVTETTVLHVEPDVAEGHWRIETDHGGWTITDAQGGGTYVVPIDEEIAQEIANRGPRFELESTGRDVALEPDTLEREELRDFDIGHDGLGYER